MSVGWSVFLVGHYFGALSNMIIFPELLSVMFNLADCVNKAAFVPALLRKEGH